MAGKLDWAKTQSADYGTSNPGSFTLSLEGVKLLLVLLNARAIYRGAWVVGGTPPTNSEWDDIQEFVSNVADSLFFETGDGMEVCILEDQKTAGTNGGAFTTGAWRTRDLNTKVHDDIGVTLSGNEFVLPVGKYLLEARLPAYRVDQHRGRVYNVSDSVVALEGENAFARFTWLDHIPATVRGVVDIPSSKTFKLEHRCATTNLFGAQMNTAFTVPYEVYSQVIIQKIG